MAFQAPGAGQVLANRKILEQLEEQKKRLRLQHTPQTNTTGTAAAASTSPMSPSTQVTGGHMVMDSQQMTVAQKTALQHAMANSVGYFITQDSSFGNLILPVLPRFEK